MAGRKVLDAGGDAFLAQEQLARLVLKPLDGQGAVAVAGRLQQDMAEARAGPDE